MSLCFRARHNLSVSTSANLKDALEMVEPCLSCLMTLV